ncbi:MAG: hypothetical protein GY765_08065 [bacterium]|nr:hypothetical protein [bacterium]
MSNADSLTIKIPLELKLRLEQKAKYQGISLNQLSTYLLTTQLTQMEILSAFEGRLARKSIAELKEKAGKILGKVPDHPVPTWDSTTYLKPRPRREGVPLRGQSRTGVISRSLPACLNPSSKSASV